MPISTQKTAISWQYKLNPIAKIHFFRNKSLETGLDHLNFNDLVTKKNALIDFYLDQGIFINLIFFFEVTT